MTPTKRNHYVIAAICFSVGALVLGVLFGLNPWLLFLGVGASSLVLSALAAKFDPDVRSLRSAVRSEERPDLADDPLVRSNWSDGRGVGGFRAISGESVGGGLYARVKLEPREQVVVAVSCLYAPNRFIASAGYLTVTRARLIFTGPRRFGTPPFLERLNPIRNLIALDLRDVRSCTPRAQANVFVRLLALSGSWQRWKWAIVVQMRDDKTYAFWPSVLNIEGLCERIENSGLDADR